MGIFPVGANLNVKVGGLPDWVMLSGSGTVASEALVQVKTYIAGLLRNLGASVDNLGATRTFVTRKGGVTQNLSPTIPDVTAGLFIDTVNADTVSNGDLWNYVWNEAVGGTGTIYWAIAQFTANNGHVALYYQQPTSSVAGGATNYAGINGRWTLNATELQRQITCYVKGTRTNLSVNISTNTLSGNCTVTSRLNTAAGGMSFVITSGSGAGIFDDGGSGSDAIAGTGDLIDTQFVAVGTGSIQAATIGSVITASAGTASDMFISANNTTRAASATVHYLNPLETVLSLAVTTENAVNQVQFGFPMSITNFRVAAFSNTYSGSYTVTLRKNGTDVITLTIGAGVTAEVSDLSTVISFAPTDLVSLSIAGGTSGTLTPKYIAYTLSDDSLPGQACM